jgi:hypothetical protein
MVTKYPVKLAVTLVPVIGHVFPEVLIKVPGQNIHHILTSRNRFELEFTECRGWIEILFLNKPDLDSKTAVIIDSISFFEISDPKFLSKGIYYPAYPKPWTNSQPNLKQELLGETYLGWNGTWRLDFDVPVFTWMHKVQNLGWIYN